VRGPPIILSPAPPPGIRGLRTTLVLVVLLCFALVGYLLFRAFGERGTPAVEPRAITARGDLAADEKSTIDLFNQSAPSVVFITRFGARYDPARMRPVEIPEGTGSGFIWDNGGDVVTNYHVIQGASGAKVTLSNHETYDAELVGAAPEYDLAVLRIHATKSRLPPIQIGTSADLKVGQKVFAIGNPFGLDQTLTTGVVSATGRAIRGVANNLIEDVIQTDAAINPGNSGGPLLDSAGRLIGVNTAIYSQSGASAGIGFAVPVDTVNRIVPQLVASGKVVRPRLGVLPVNDQLNQEIMRRADMEGLLVRNVQPGSPAEAAGIRGTRQAENGGVLFGDIILDIDGRKIRNSQELFAALGRFNAGDKVTVTVFRDGENLKLPVTLDAGTPKTQTAP
jgi:S1-C subfamily serine protease